MMVKSFQDKIQKYN